MFHTDHAAPTPLQRVSEQAGSASLTGPRDCGRGPVTFAWCAYTPTGRLSTYRHIEILYRLDRIECGAVTSLIPSQYYGLSVHQLGELLRVRERAHLPKLPEGYRWVGPQVLEDHVPDATMTAAARIAPAGAGDQLRFAAHLAAAILQRRNSR